MIRLFVFDLDGTLVQTERLKAESYAKAVIELRPSDVAESEVLDAFRQVMGQSRQRVAEYMVDRFELADAAGERMSEFGASEPWEVLVGIRLGYYDRLAGDPETLRAAAWPHNIALLDLARQTGCRTALASMSSRARIAGVLEALDLSDSFDLIVSAEDVERGKPSPDIYEFVAARLGFEPRECLVIEDSPDGVKAALAAGMHCVAVTTPFSRERVLAAGLLPRSRIVDDPGHLLDVVSGVVDEEKNSLPHEV